MTYKKRGGLRFITLGRFGMCFYISRSSKSARKLAAAKRAELRETLRLKREATYAALRGEVTSAGKFVSYALPSVPPPSAAANDTPQLDLWR